MILERFKEYGPNFGLYKVIYTDEQDRIMDQFGRTIPDEIKEGQIVGVREINFAGWAKGKTGRHALNESNTDIIFAVGLKKIDGKYNAHRWVLLDQDEKDELYRQRVCFNI